MPGGLANGVPAYEQLIGQTLTSLSCKAENELHPNSSTIYPGPSVMETWGGGPEAHGRSRLSCDALIEQQQGGSLHKSIFLKEPLLNR